MCDFKDKCKIAWLQGEFLMKVKNNIVNVYSKAAIPGGENNPLKIDIEYEKDGISKGETLQSYDQYKNNNSTTRSRTYKNLMNYFLKNSQES